MNNCSSHSIQLELPRNEFNISKVNICIEKGSLTVKTEQNGILMLTADQGQDSQKLVKQNS
jgi:hypothetical protein